MNKIVLMMGALLATATGWSVVQDPGGDPGFVKAIFTDVEFDTASSVLDHAIGYTIYPDEAYASSLNTRTTVAWRGYVRLNEGIRYDFKGRYDDFVLLTIDGSMVLSKGSECSERTGAFTPTATGWYVIDFRVGNNGGVGGCQKSSEYGILWRSGDDGEWCKIEERGEGIFKTGVSGLKPLYTSRPYVLSSSIRKNDPTVMDVIYIVRSPHATVNVRGLAFEDGERSFWKVVRAETFVEDSEGNPTAGNIGDGITANVKHTLAWKVSKDWKTDLAKVRFEIICSDECRLPFKWVTIPAVGVYPSIKFTTNEQSDVNIINALYWYYACGETDLELSEGALRNAGVVLVDRDTISQRNNCLAYIAKKQGLAMFGGVLYHHAKNVTRRTFSAASDMFCVPITDQNMIVGKDAFCIIDISGGAMANNYPVSYRDTMPLNGWNDEYKTNKIVLRRIEPGRFLEYGSRKVVISKPYYIGVFEVTQKQYELVVGSNPSYCRGDLNPVEVSWNTLRGNSSTYNWPTVTTVSPTSFIGLLQAKTGIKIDLPTEAQWEYAARAGETGVFPNGGTTYNDLSVVARCAKNLGDGRGGTTRCTSVGLYFPNAWGLYDVLGNVDEWCLDWYEDTILFQATDPTGPTTGSSRVMRGGDCRGDNLGSCTLSRRGSSNPGDGGYFNSHFGVRLAMPVESEE